MSDKMSNEFREQGERNDKFIEAVRELAEEYGIDAFFLMGLTRLTDRKGREYTHILEGGHVRKEFEEIVEDPDAKPADLKAVEGLAKMRYTAASVASMIFGSPDRILRDPPGPLGN